MTATATRSSFSAPPHHLCPANKCLEGMMISDHDLCTVCEPYAEIPLKMRKDHGRWHESFCDCNWNPELAERPGHRGNECHQCHRAGCGQITASEFAVHLVLCCPISPPMETCDAED